MSTPHFLSQPLTLTSNCTLPNRLVQAPLAGYSCAPFRVITQRLGKPGFCATEMISAKTLKHKPTPQTRFLWRDPEENITCYQISTNNAEDAAYASTQVSEAGADIIDLNCGCPVKKIRAKGTGSKLLEDPELIYTLIKTIKKNTDAAVSIKIRISTPLNDSNDLGALQAAESAGAHLAIIHGRHWKERYDTPTQTSRIAYLKKQLAIPVIANGDVEDTESAKAILETTGCDGLMIARASVGNPWLFEQIRCELNGKPFTPPTLPEVGNVFIEHLERLIALENEKLAVLQSRKLAKYYARMLPNRAPFVSQMQISESAAEMFALIRHFFMRLT